jgi:hypothetical protein
LGVLGTVALVSVIESDLCFGWIPPWCCGGLKLVNVVEKKVAVDGFQAAMTSEVRYR